MGKLPLGLGEKMRGALPALKLPELGREVEVPVYVIHNSESREDYFFLFDFEVFVDRSQSGSFVRPKLRVWAGRDDFDRANFARHFRQVFTEEFDRMRGAVTDKGTQMGWLTMNFGIEAVASLVTGLVANVVLLIATGAGRAIFGTLELPAWLKGKSAETKIEDRVDALKSKVDVALAAIEVGIHSELAEHAKFYDVGSEREWPLPTYVKKHLGDRESGSWW